MLVLVSLLLGACAGGPKGAPIDAKRQEELAAAWKLYLTNDAKWPERREEWLAGPPQERQLLLDNLYLELLRDEGASSGNSTAARALRARREIEWVGSEAIVFLVGAMRGLSSRKPVDNVALDRVAATLVGLHATDELVSLLESDLPDEGAGPLKLRLAALRALTADRPGLEQEKVTMALVGRLAHDPAWEVRAGAAEALRARARVPAVRVALVRALGDDDGYVRARAVMSVVPALNPQEDSAALEKVVHLLLSDPDAGTRGAAAEALGLFAFDGRVGPALVHALADGDWKVVDKAAQSLVNVPAPEVQLALVDTLERSIRGRNVELTSALLVALRASVGASPANINPDGWRELIRARAAAAKR